MLTRSIEQCRTLISIWEVGYLLFLCFSLFFSKILKSETFWCTDIWALHQRSRQWSIVLLITPFFQYRELVRRRWRWRRWHILRTVQQQHGPTVSRLTSLLQSSDRAIPSHSHWLHRTHPRPNQIHIPRRTLWKSQLLFLQRRRELRKLKAFLSLQTQLRSFCCVCVTADQEQFGDDENRLQWIFI